VSGVDCGASEAPSKSFAAADVVTSLDDLSFPAAPAHADMLKTIAATNTIDNFFIYYSSFLSLLIFDEYMSIIYSFFVPVNIFSIFSFLILFLHLLNNFPVQFTSFMYKKHTSFLFLFPYH